MPPEYKCPKCGAAQIGFFFGPRCPNGCSDQDPPIFSGNASVHMWDEINGAESFEDVRKALYSIGCKCQELEAEVRRLKAQSKP